MSTNDELGPRALERATADWQALKERNAERLQSLAARGVGVNLLPQLVDHLMNAIYPEGSIERMRFLRSWEEKAAVILDELEAEVRRQTLLAPGPAAAGNGHRP